MIATKIIEFHAEAIAAAWDIPLEKAIENARDGRASFFWIEANLAHRWRFRQEDNLLIRPTGERIGLRMLTDSVNFSRSGDHGMKRSLDENGWLNHINSLDQFIVADIDNFPYVKLYYLDPGVILKWWKTGSLKVPTELRDARGRIRKEIVVMKRAKFHKAVKAENSATV